MHKLKKLFYFVITAVFTVTSLIGGTSLSASADTNLITNSGPYTGDENFISSYSRNDYLQHNAFEIQFKYNYVGLPTSNDGQNYLGYNDTFEFIVFDSNYQGWQKTTVGPAGVDITSAPDIMPSANTTYSVLVPISTIEEKLSTGRTPYAINLQTGNIGTSRVSIVSLKYIKNTYVQEEFTATGAWTKGTASDMTVSPSTAAIVNANEWNIRVSAFDLSAWANPTVEVTATYNSTSNNVQAEILVPTGEYDYNGREIFEPVVANYVSRSTGTYTYTTDLSGFKDITSFLACYDKCTVTKIQVYDGQKPIPPEPYIYKIAKEIKVAWNLGNALECVDSNGNVNEKAWGNPKTTKKLIQAVKAAGFNTVKVPISYLNTIDGNNEIDDAYMARIQQVVNYAYNMGMYVVIDIHNDGDPSTLGSWIDITKTGSEFEEIKNKFAAVWTDIANNFAEYDQRLIFQSANELVNHTWSNPTATEYSNINALNEAFVSAVRNAEGSNNDNRALIVVGFATNIDYTIAGFVKPNDDMLMLDVHYMEPYSFVSDYYNSTTVWDENESYGGKAYMEARFATISEFAGNLGMPVFLGEYGATNKNNTAQRANYAYWLNYYAAEYGIVTAYWDNGATGYGGSGLFDRINNTITEDGQAIVNSIFAGYNLEANPHY